MNNQQGLKKMQIAMLVVALAFILPFADNAMATDDCDDIPVVACPGKGSCFMNSYQYCVIKCINEETGEFDGFLDCEIDPGPH